MESSRRQLLAATGGLAVGVSTASSVASGELDPYGPQEPFVTIYGYDDRTADLDAYRPRLVLRTLDQRPTDLYCWYVENNERDTDIAEYWAFYPEGQEGLTSEDSHPLDREPIYVEIDPSKESVVAVYYDKWHWTVGSTTSPHLHGGKPTLQAINPWHNYTETADSGLKEPTLGDLKDQYGSWVRNGWPVHRRSVVHPWDLPSRGHWWRSELDATRARLSQDVYELTGQYVSVLAPST